MAELPGELAGRRAEQQTVLKVRGREYRFTDIDGDGVMKLEEALLVGLDEEQFLELDADRDGVVTRTEFRRFVLKEAGKAELEVGGRVYWFNDVDGDGEMSREEAMLGGMTEAQFAELDADGDGAVTEKEFRRFVLRAAGKTELEVGGRCVPPARLLAAACSGARGAPSSGSGER